MSNKTLNLTDDLYQYVLDISLREHPVQAELREETAQLSTHNMQTAPEQGQFLQLLIRMQAARKTLEIGTYTGYSALAVALALPADGRIIACDVNQEWTDIAKRYWQKAQVADKIDLRLAPALETLDKLLESGEANSFDFAFIDADKSNYDNYYEKALLLIRKGGVIAIDNVLWDGLVIDESVNDSQTRSIRALNEKILHDKRVEISMLPLADGVTLVYKL